MNLTVKEKKILSFLQGDIPIVKKPFYSLAKNLNCSQTNVIETIQELIKKKIIRRISAILFHTNVGFTYNAMVAWKCKNNEYDDVGMKMSLHNNVSHCYQRECPDDFPYPLFTMIHATSEKEFSRIINNLKLISRDSEYIILRSTKEWKKTSMKYSFEEE